MLWATPFTAAVARQLAPAGSWGRTGSLRPAALRLASAVERGVADARVGALEGTRAQAQVKILHFSDIHFHTPSLAGRVPRLKEVLGYANLYLTKRRASFQAPAAAGALLSLALQLQPDVLVFSGDLTSTGTRAEFELAKKHLAPLRKLPRAASDAPASADASDAVPLIMIPGNHDRYTYKNFYEMERHFAREMLGGGPNTPLRYQYALNPNDSGDRNGNGVADEATSSGLVFVTIDHCRPSLVSNGHHHQPGTLERLEKILARDARRAIVIGHYPVLEEDGRRLYTRYGRSLTDVADLYQVLRKHPPLAYLCGHHHHGFVVRDAATQFWHINCGTSGQVGEASALEIDVEQMSDTGAFRIARVQRHALL